jgi:hypothetical protein
VVDPEKGHGYGMNGIWPDALKSWMLKRGLLAKPAGINRFQVENRAAENSCPLRYSTARGMYLEGSAIRPDVIQILTVDGRCLAACNGTMAGDFGCRCRCGIIGIAL